MFAGAQMRVHHVWDLLWKQKPLGDIPCRELNRRSYDAMRKEVNEPGFNLQRANKRYPHVAGFEEHFNVDSDYEDSDSEHKSEDDEEEEEEENDEDKVVWVPPANCECGFCIPPYMSLKEDYSKICNSCEDDFEPDNKLVQAIGVDNIGSWMQELEQTDQKNTLQRLIWAINICPRCEKCLVHCAFCGRAVRATSVLAPCCQGRMCAFDADDWIVQQWAKDREWKDRLKRQAARRQEHPQ